MIPFIPPKTFTDLFSYSKVLSARITEKGISDISELDIKGTSDILFLI